jgi:hypothetical protein
MFMPISRGKEASFAPSPHARLFPVPTVAHAQIRMDLITHLRTRIPKPARPTLHAHASMAKITLFVCLDLGLGNMRATACRSGF